MEKYKRYYGLLVFIVIVMSSLVVAYKLAEPSISTSRARDSEIEAKTFYEILENKIHE